MGLLARHLEEVRFDRTAWLNDDEGEFDGQLSSAGVRINERTAFSLSAFWRCIDLLTSSISQSPKDIILKIGGLSYPEYGNKPAWLATPNPNDPLYTIDDHFAQVALSVLLNGNAFVLASPYVWDARQLVVLNPNRVTVKTGPVYEVRDERGRVETYQPMQVLHIKWLPPLPGSLRSLNPISSLSRSLGAAIASEDFSARFFGQGAALSFGVETPYPMTPEKKTELQDSLKVRYAGLRNSHAIGVLTDGAKFVTGLSSTPEQAQMLDSRKMAVIDTARPFGVPPVLAGSNEPGSVSYNSADVSINVMYQRHAVMPLASKIEGQYRHLISVPAGITDPSASMQFRFNLDWIARANLLERYQAHGEGIEKGFITPDEARAKEDLPPLPGGNRLYMQQQMVPLDDPTRSTKEAA